MKIYVASSWRNTIQPDIVALLRERGHEVYDFKNHGFHWSEIDPKWKEWNAEQFRDGLECEIAINGYCADMTALEDCDVCVLVLPCGRSAHLEAGWAIGAGKPTIILLADGCEPELMYKMTPFICTNTVEMFEALEAINSSIRRCRVCGCPDDHACPGGCYWVEEDLCSACAGHEHEGSGE